MAEEERITKMKIKEVLISEFNKHLMMYVTNLIEATFTSGRPKDEIVLTVIQPSGNPQIPAMERKIKAKEAQERSRRELDRQDSILRVIEGLIKDEDKKETKFD